MDITGTDNVTNLLQTYLDVQTSRSQVIAGNIANADTPGYVAKELDFNEYLQEAARQSSLPASQQDRQMMAGGPARGRFSNRVPSDSTATPSTPAAKWQISPRRAAALALVQKCFNPGSDCSGRRSAGQIVRSFINVSL